MRRNKKLVSAIMIAFIFIIFGQINPVHAKPNKGVSVCKSKLSCIKDGLIFIGEVLDIGEKFQSLFSPQDFEEEFKQNKKFRDEVNKSLGEILSKLNDNQISPQNAENKFQEIEKRLNSIGELLNEFRLKFDEKNIPQVRKDLDQESMLIKMKRIFEIAIEEVLSKKRIERETAGTRTENKRDSDNVAFGATAEASALPNVSSLWPQGRIEAYQECCGPGEALDGDYTSSWSAGDFAGKGNEKYITIDLGGSYKINQIIATPDFTAKNPEVELEILVERQNEQGNSSNAHWTLTRNLKNMENVFLMPPPYRELPGVRKVTIRTTKSESWVGWREIEIYGERIWDKE